MASAALLAPSASPSPAAVRQTTLLAGFAGPPKLRPAPIRQHHRALVVAAAEDAACFRDGTYPTSQESEQIKAGNMRFNVATTQEFMGSSVGYNGGIPADVLAEGHIPEQRSSQGSHPFPHVFVPADSNCTLRTLLEGIQRQKGAIEHALHHSGAVLFRGFEVLSASDFNDVLEALGWDNFEYNGRGQHKKAIVGRVVTANEQPVHLPIGFHNEMAYQLKSPSKVMFYCEVEPPEGAGGATPIVQGHIVYQRIEKEMPEFLKMVEEKGLTYINKLCSDPSAKDSWQAVLQASTKEEAERKAKERNSFIEWKEDGTALLVMGPRIGTKVCESNGRKVWFNSVGATYQHMLNFSSGELDISFGDGTPLNRNFLTACKKIMEDEQVAFRWHKGDVLVIHNDAVLHAREPSRPPRRILAALAAN